MKIKNRIPKRTHDIKLAESLSTIAKKLDEVKETTQKLGEVIEKPQPEKNIPQPAIEHTQPLRSIENNEGVIYDAEFENTFNKMKIKTGSFQTYENLLHGWMWNGHPVKTSGGTEVEINKKEFNINPCIQKVLVNTSYNFAN